MTRRTRILVSLLLPLALVGCSDVDMPETRTGTVNDARPQPNEASGSVADTTPDAGADTTEVTAGTVSPSFDCDASGLGDVETLICADSALSTLDVRLDSVWRVALERARGTAMPQTWVDEMRDYQGEWFERRNACATASDELPAASLAEDAATRQCAETAYRERIARLQADWGLARTTVGPIFWVCGDDPANDFVTTYFATDPEAVRVERGGQSEVFLRTPTTSGARYEGPAGKSFSDRGSAASFVWPEGETRICARRD